MQSIKIVQNILDLLKLDSDEIRIYQMGYSSIKHEFEIWKNDYLISGTIDISGYNKIEKTNWCDNRYFTETSLTFKIDVLSGQFYNNVGEEITSFVHITDASNYLDMIKVIREKLVEDIEQNPDHYVHCLEA